MSDQKAAILLSRQAMRPTGSTPWIKNSYEALKWIKANNYILISSVGMQTWEMITAIASNIRINQEIYINCKDDKEFGNLTKSIIKQFELDINKSHLFPVYPQQNQSHLHLRDEIVLRNADILIPISIRSDGFMISYINANNNNQIIINKFQTKYNKRTNSLKYSIGTDKINPQLKEIGKAYLIHWTRTANYNWPDESKTSYWRGVASSIDYPRGAIDTLKHILSTGKIIPSSRHMPSGVKTVSFTSLPPIESLSLMKWRTRYREMSFEPYGIAIEKKWGIENGITAVNYYNPELKEKPNLEEIWYSHSKGIKTDWQKEHEYRYNKDFDLTKVPKDKLLIICYKPDEIQKIETESEIKIIPLTTY